MNLFVIFKLFWNNIYKDLMKRNLFSPLAKIKRITRSQDWNNPFVYHLLVG